MIRSYVRERDPEQLRSEMGAGAADIAEIVSDVREQLPDLKPPPELEDPEQTRFRLFDSVAAFLKGASRTQPLVLMLDDLHWADKPSLLLLEFVARELAGARLLLVGTYRDVELNRRHPLAQSLGELTRERLFQRVLLRGLSGEDVARFIEATSGIRPPEGLVAAVHTQTEGNPLFVTEVVRLLVQEGQLTAHPATSAHPEPVEGRGGVTESLRQGSGQAWTVRIPEGVREVIGRRLDRLSERCNETLTVASVVGREFGLDLLDRLIEDPSADSGQRMSEDRVLDVLEEALSARVVEELTTGVGRYQFTHALIQETLLGELSITRRVRVHARIAEALEELYGAEAESRAAELAHHFAQAEAVLGTEKMIRYSVAAGERALDALAYEEAEEHFQRAVTAKEGQPADAETAGALFGLGVARAATIERSRAQEAWDLIERAFDYYVEVGDSARAVAVAGQPVGIGAWIKGRAEVLTRALELVPPDSLDWGRLLSQYGFFLLWETVDFEGMQTAFGRAIAIAQREEDVALEARTIAYSAQADLWWTDLPESLEKALRAIELTRRVSDLQAEVRVRTSALVALAVMGRPDEARPHGVAMLEASESLRDRNWLAQAPMYLGELSALEGDWRAAHALFDRGLGVLSIPFSLGLKALPHYEVDEREQGDSYVKTLVEMGGGGIEMSGNASLAWTVPLASRITGVADNHDLAEASARTVLGNPTAPPLVTTAARVGLALLAVHRQDAGSAREQYEALGALRGDRLALLAIAAGRVMGLLAHTMGRLDDAETHFEDALAFCRKAGYRPELVTVRLCRHASRARRRRRPGEGHGTARRVADHIT